MARSRSGGRVTQDGTASMLLDDQLCFALYSATHSIQKLYRPALEALGLTYPQYLVLLVLWEHRELSVTEIGEQLFLKSATLTPLLKRMESGGLVSRTRSPVDERRVLVSLTKDSVKLQRKVRRITEGVTCAAAEASEDPQLLKQLLVELRDQLPEDT